MNHQAKSNVIPAYSMPTFEGGAWGTAGGLAVKESLSLGSMVGVMDVLHSMDAVGIAATLREAGFSVTPGVEERGVAAILTAVDQDLKEAIRLRVSGNELAGAGSPSFAAKVAMVSDMGVGDALQEIRAVMRAPAVVVDFVGDAAVGGRVSLAMIAGQALSKGIQGFGFEGVAGKYEVPMTMNEVSALHKFAAHDVALEKARAALGVWAGEGRVGVMDDLIPDGVQRLLRGTVSVESAAAIVDAIEGGRLGQFASEVGSHTFSRLLMDQGYDVNAPTVDAQAAALGLTMITPDIERGQYYGPVVGGDHRAALVKSSRDKAVDLPYVKLADGQEKPGLGEMVKMKFTGGELTVSLAKEVVKGGVGGR